MVTYRLYCLDGAAKIVTAHWVEADTDEAAMDAARARKDAVACEIWDQDRLVGRIEPFSSTDEPDEIFGDNPAPSPPPA